jgi:hypothetical protein
MALEFPNTLEAAGIFDGRVPSASPTPIVNASGIAEYDPASTPADLRGGFTRGVVPELINAPQPAGYYIVGMERPIDGGEQLVLATPILLGSTGTLLSPVVAAIGVRDGFVQIANGSVLPVPAEPSAYDFSFYLGIFRINYNQNLGALNTP